MSRSKRIISLVMVLVVVAGLVTGIALYTAGNAPSTPSASGSTATGGGETATREPGLYTEAGKRVENPNPMITVGTKEISFDEFRSSYMYWKGILEMYMSGGDPNFWQNDLENYYANMLLEQTENELINSFLLLNMAAEQNVTLTKEEQDELNTKIEEELTANADNLQAWLEENFYTSEEMFRTQREQSALVVKMEKTLTDELFAANEKELLDGVYTAKHILLQPEAAPEASSTSTASDASASEDASAASDAAALADEALLARAQNLVAQIQNSADPAATFDALMNEFSQDPGLANYPDGYTFSDGAMVPEFYAATKALEIGGISEPVKTEHGYHIIMRLPLDEQFVRDNLANTSSTIPAVNSLWAEIMNTALENAKEKFPVAFGEYYNLVAPLNIS